MLQQLTAATEGQGWAVASLLFFTVLFAIVAVRTLRAERSVCEAKARLPLEEPRSIEVRHD